MAKLFFLLLLLSLTFFSCQKENSVEANWIEIPEWLNNKIEIMEEDSYYIGTKVFRHQWSEKFIYYINIPLSSCSYCELYEQNGNKVVFVNDSTLQDYQNNRKNEVLIWERK